MLPSRDSSHRKRHPQIKGEKMGKKHTMHMDSVIKQRSLFSDKVDFKLQSEGTKKDISYFLREA